MRASEEGRAPAYIGRPYQPHAQVVPRVVHQQRCRDVRVGAPRERGQDDRGARRARRRPAERRRPLLAHGRAAGRARRAPLRDCARTRTHAERLRLPLPRAAIARCWPGCRARQPGPPWRCGLHMRRPFKLAVQQGPPRPPTMKETFTASTSPAPAQRRAIPEPWRTCAATRGRMHAAPGQVRVSRA